MIKRHEWTALAHIGYITVLEKVKKVLLKLKANQHNLFNAKNTNQ